MCRSTRKCVAIADGPLSKAKKAEASRRDPEEWPSRERRATQQRAVVVQS
jgi:hypothetical protein